LLPHHFTGDVRCRGKIYGSVTDDPDRRQRAGRSYGF
jgi:hypothetical protein